MTGVASPRKHLVFRSPIRFVPIAVLFTVMSAPALLYASPPQTSAAPQVTKIEPPNWWIGLTSETLFLLSGHDLEATHVSCNLPTLRVMRTQATAGGDYLFVWLKIGASTRSGTAICRVTTPNGPTSFELPLASRAATQRKFQGLASDEIPARDDGDLRTSRERLPQLKKTGTTLLRLAPPAMRDADPVSADHGVVDFYSVDPRRGTLQDLQEVVTSVHDQQIKVVLDLELIHISSHHPWVAKPPLAEWLGAPPGRPGAHSQHLPPVPSSGRILDTENPLVALYLLQNAIWWTESSGVDEIRVTSDPNATSEFWASWLAELKKIYPHLVIIREPPRLQ
jgi:neopullulanase